MVFGHLEVLHAKFHDRTISNLGDYAEQTNKQTNKPSNILLHKMKIKNTDNCDYCGAVDYVEHMFIHCPRLRGLNDI